MLEYINALIGVSHHSLCQEEVAQGANTAGRCCLGFQQSDERLLWIFEMTLCQYFSARHVQVSHVEYAYELYIVEMCSVAEVCLETVMQVSRRSSVERGPSSLLIN